MRIAALTLFMSVSLSLAAQHRVDPRNRYVRVLAIVPMVGSGTPDDPMRPDYAPLPPSAVGTTTAPTASSGTSISSGVTPSSPEGIIAFSYQVSDDGKFALAEFVARTRDVFKALLADTRPGVKVFIKGTDSPAAILAAFQALKAGFILDSLGTVVP